MTRVYVVVRVSQKGSVVVVVSGGVVVSTVVVVGGVVVVGSVVGPRVVSMQMVVGFDGVVVPALAALSVCGVTALVVRTMQWWIVTGAAVVVAFVVVGAFVVVFVVVVVAYLRPHQTQIN